MPEASPSSGGAGFSVMRTLKLGSFHVGSALSDLLTSAVWNRILISDLGTAAWPVALLSALRYLLAPLSLWSGYRSDQRPLLGSRRLAYIWIGRALMIVALTLLPVTTVILSQDVASPLGWAVAAASFTLYGAGTLTSGAPFLALVHDSAPYSRRGLVIGIVQLILIASFAVIPLLYARSMPTYDPARFTRLVFGAVLAAAIFWLFSVWGEERPKPATTAASNGVGLLGTFRAIWGDESTRRYAIFLGASAFFAFMQDAMLEPFGGDVFGLPVGETTRFNAYWGAGVLAGMLGTLALTRRKEPHKQQGTTSIGLAGLSIAFLALGAFSILREQAWLRPALVLFGLGLGVFTVGGLSLLMAMSREEWAGSYLGLWSVIQLVGRGTGIAMGGFLRDLALTVSGDFAAAYATVFFVEALGVALTLVLLRRVGVARFAAGRSKGAPAGLTASSAS